MKAFYLFLIALFIQQCSSKDYCSKVSNPKSAKDCYEAEPEEGYYKCCLIDAKEKGKNEEKFCNPLKKEEYDNINEFKEKTKKEVEKEGVVVEKLEIDCTPTPTPTPTPNISKYLVLSVISLLLFLL